VIYWVAAIFILTVMAGAVGLGGLLAGLAWIGQALLGVFVLGLVAAFLAHVMAEYERF
jgi:uncharacterized membrane protein YtjA (UPF0391 family)